jgi:hypothetical protein
VSLPAIAELLCAFERVMRERGLRWYVFGAQAVLAYGRPRFTADVDVTVDFAGQEAIEIVDALARQGFMLRFTLSEERLREARMLPLVHTPTTLPVDLVVAGPGLDEEFLARARHIDVAGIAIPIVSVEDLLAMKVLAGRRKDLEDVRGLLIEQHGRIDLDRTRDVLGALEAASAAPNLVSRLERLIKAARAESSGAAPRRSRPGKRRR